jgi:RNA polymerase-associated protein RTF1
MSQSDSDADSDDATGEKPIYAYDGLYHDAADKARIDALPQVEREVAIAARSEEVERLKQNSLIHEMLRRREKEAKKQEKKAKRKVDDAGLDDSQRKSSRQRTKVGGESKGAIDRYKQQRAEKVLRDERRQNRSARSVTPEDKYGYSDEDAQGESDYDDRRPARKRSPTPIKDDPPADLADVNRAKVGRDNFAQVCQTPGFDQLIVGCYARVNLGPGRDPNVNEYRLCIIKGIQKGRPYAMMAPNNTQFLTDKYAICAFGKAERAWSFLECSMGPFIEKEWTKYRAEMANVEKPMPTKGAIARKLQDINTLINHKFLDKEITAKLEAQNELMAMVTKSKEKEEILDQIVEARRTRKYELIDELEEKLQNIVPMKLAMNTSLIKKEAPKINTEQERLTALNVKNNHLNTENIRKAQLAEMHARRVRQQQRARESPGPKDDLFGDGSDISRAGTPINGVRSRAGTPGLGTPRSSTPVPLKPMKKKGGLPTIRRAALDDEIIAGMDLGLEI